MGQWNFMLQRQSSCLMWGIAWCAKKKVDEIKSWWSRRKPFYIICTLKSSFETGNPQPVFSPFAATFFCFEIWHKFEEFLISDFQVAFGGQLDELINFGGMIPPLTRNFFILFKRIGLHESLAFECWYKSDQMSVVSKFSLNFLILN